jgi:hypothetical protein
MKNGGGQFTPKLGAHFELELGGHFKLKLGGQYHWNLHIYRIIQTNYFLKRNVFIFKQLLFYPI